ncbi:MAG: hypothetical protein ACSLE9_07975 [Burkholderiaceae bacterium]
MAVESADVEIRLTTKAGAAGDSTASTPAASLGKYASTTVLTDATLENLFDNVLGAEAAAGRTTYRAIAVYNSHPTDTWESVAAYIPSQIAGGADLSIGVDPAGPSDIDSAGAQGEEIATETDAPAGVTFSTPSTYGDGIVLGDLAPDECVIVWARLVVPADTNALSLDGALIAVRGLSDA